jgi:thioredoxin 1
MVSEFPDARFYKFDVEECPNIAQELGISVMPTFTIFKNGDVQEGVSESKPKDLWEKIKGNMN